RQRDRAVDRAGHRDRTRRTYLGGGNDGWRDRDGPGHADPGDRTVKVLVVDDEPQIRRALRTSLEAHGYEVTAVGTGEEGVLGAAEMSPDLILLDLGLPDVDGADVIQRIRAFSDVPIIVVSVREGQHDKVAALDAGADDFVTKPFGMEELLARS